MSEESRDSLTEYRQQVIGAIVEQRSIVASVCQLCGEISRISGVFGWIAFVDVDGKREFICFDCGEKRGRRTGRKLLQENAKRFCESCRKRFRPTQKKDIAYWVCDPCIRNIPCPPNEVRDFLRDLTVQRYLQGSGMSNDSLRDWHIQLAIQKFDMEGLRQNPIEKLRLEATREKRLNALLRKLAAFHGIEESLLTGEEPSQEDNLQNVIAKEGDIWTITFQGNASRLRDMKGMNYIATLLQYPDRNFAATELVNLAEYQPRESSKQKQKRTRADALELGLRETTNLGDRGEAADQKTLSQLKGRQAEIHKEKEEANELQNWETREELEDEEEKLHQYIRQTFGLGGKSRRSGSHADKVRINVTRAIKRVLDKIRKQDQALAAYLKSTIKTGYQVSYTPDPNNPVSWTFLPS